jgi:hypothetical protein
MGLERDHLVNNLLDQIAELKLRLEALERSALRGTIGPYVEEAQMAATGYVVLVIHESGITTEYRLLAATA